MDREQNEQILHDFIYNDKIPNPDEYDYYSLYQKLAQYAMDEDIYNSSNGINPEDYENVDQDLPKHEESIQPPIEEKPESEVKPPVVEPSIPDNNGSEGENQNNSGNVTQPEGNEGTNIPVEPNKPEEEVKPPTEEKPKPPAEEVVPPSTESGSDEIENG